MKKSSFITIIILVMVLATGFAFAEEGEASDTCDDVLDVTAEEIVEEEIVEEITEAEALEENCVAEDIIEDVEESIVIEAEVEESQTTSLEASGASEEPVSEPMNGWSEDGTQYFVDDEKQTGFVEIDGVTYYFNKKGVLVQNSSEELFPDENGVYYYVNQNGVVDLTYCGLAKSKTNQYYVTDGTIDKSYRGLARSSEDKNVYYHVWNGKVNKDYTGLSKSVNNWYYVENGVYDKSDATYTGFSNTYESKNLYYTEDSKMSKTYIGLVQRSEDSDEYYHVWNGKFDSDYTGLSKSVRNWYYVENGVYDKTNAHYNGPAQSYKTEAWYHVESSKMRKKDGESTTQFEDVEYNYQFTEGRLSNSFFAYGGMLYYADESGHIKTESGVIKAYDGTYCYVKPETGKVRRNPGFINDDEGNKRYIKLGGKMLCNDTYTVDGKTYGAGEDAVLAEKGWVKTGDYYLYYVNYGANSVSLKARNLIMSRGLTLSGAYAYARDIKYEVAYGNLSVQGTTALADYVFTYGKGNCYRKSAAFWYLAKVLGYNGLNHVQGTVNRGTYHAWCEVAEGGTVYIFDPTGERGQNYDLYHKTYREQKRWNYDSGYKKVAI